MVAAISVIFLRINLPNFVQYHRFPFWYHLGERRSPSTLPLNITLC